MKKNQKRGIIAFTLADLLVCLAVVAVIVLLAIPALASTSAKSVRISCMNNLRQIAVAFRVWEGGNSGNFPQVYAGSPQYPLINSANPVVSSQGVAWSPSGSPCPNQFTVFLQMSNELNNSQLTACPADTTDRFAATNFAEYKIQKNSVVSYFVGKAAADPFPRMFLVGDRNISSDTTSITSPYGYSPISSGLPDAGAVVALTTNFQTAPLSNSNFGWTSKIHNASGNVALADGSVQNYNSSSLKTALANSSDTNTAGNTLLFP